MRTVVGTVEDCIDMFEGSAQTRIIPLSPTNLIENPVTYKLVRVAGDGRLVPATDEEIVEVNETGYAYSIRCLSESCPRVSFSVVPTRRNFSSSGLLQSEYVEPYTQEVNTQPEDERLAMIHSLHMLSAPPDANIQLCNETDMFDEDHVHHEPLLQQPIPFSSNVQHGCNVDQSNTVEPTAPPADAQRPDFSLVRGEICLNNLPIKALQETFKATFGRATTVTDKTWLKRRITMGLTNSCNVPTTNLTVKDKKLVENQDKANDAPSSTDHADGHSNASGHSLTEDFSSEERAAKRVRKPTRRYIEELSENDEKQPVVTSKDEKLSEKSEVRSISVSLGKRVTVTRVVSLAGSEIEVPYVSLVRRSCPRENIMALMECHSSCLEAKASSGESNMLHNEVLKSASGPDQKESATSSSNNEEDVLTEVDEDMETENIDSSGNSSDDNNNIGLPTMQGGGLRRKHHRAWTLSEVTQLVEGVAKYGAGKWSEIKKLSFSSHSYRTPVDLKDKWRNLLRTNFAQSPSNIMGSLKKHGSMHIPMQILLQVRELAEKQALVPPNH
ncbi:hypothetical protein HID58_072194 [Brassica napus]|uniref:BnaC06g24140D protein n=2 Tax=Brassica napus TaxID=3708 RepID=A0A078FDU0_BRANA|nr:hypothetical protein HID58_072194 [Brassica napus]CAF2061485.1 unnamed protein product [Brassica napus]CDY11162.1 BnaC06g24140D [Brassica napus]